MSGPKPTDDLQQRLLVMRIITVALASSPIVIAIVLMVAMQPDEDAEPLVALRVIVPIIVVVSAFVTNGLLPIFIRRQMRSEIDAAAAPRGSAFSSASSTTQTSAPQSSLSEKLFSAFQTAHLIRLAGLEGPAVFAAIAYLLDPFLLYPVLVLLCVAGMLAQWPTEQRMRAFAE